MLSRIFRGELDNTENRKRQIDTLKIFNDNVTEVKEDVEYKVEFAAGGIPMTILVILCPEFPIEKPVLKIIPQVNHPWVNEKSEITTAPGLLNYTIHSDLGRVVQAIIRDFERHPPPVGISTSAGTSQMQSMGQEVVASSDNSPTYGLPRYPAPAMGYNFPLLAPSGAFPNLADMTLAELGDLNESEDKQAEFIDLLPQTVQLYQKLEDVIAHTEELAKENIGKRSQLEKLKESVLEKMKTVKAQKERYDGLSQEYQRISDKYSPQNIKDSLRLAAIKSDEESEEVAEKFLSREIDVEHFVASYMEKRTLSQCRKTKEEKLASQLRELQKAGY